MAEAVTDSAWMDLNTKSDHNDIRRETVSPDTPICRFPRRRRYRSCLGHGPCDQGCDQDSSERAERGEIGRDCMVSSAEASVGMSDRPGRVATAHGLLITQRWRSIAADTSTAG